MPPSHLPDLSDAKEIAIDTENRDPRLKELGPGYIRRDGNVAGIGVATDTGFRGYFPFAHAGGGNLDRGLVTRWLAEQCTVERDYIFAYAQYDLGWLRSEGIEIKRGRIVDISIAATLLDEEDPAGYSLDAIARRWVGRGKDEVLLREAARNWGVDPKGELWKLPAKCVGPYGETDPELTLAAWRRLKEALKAEDLWNIFQLECELTPILFEMFWRGIRVDLDYGQKLNERWQVEETETLRSIGFSVKDLWTPDAVVAYCKKHGIRFPLTDKGNPSITADFMTNSGHPQLLPLRKARAINRTRSTFLESVLLQNHINGRIHPQYVQLASDDGGTRTGRLSCRNPNAQQFPKRSTLFDAKAIRKCLLPEEGKLWAKFDYWSQEPTLQCHYGLLTRLPGADAVRDQFRDRVKLYTIIERATGGKCNYDQAKEVVLGRSYGMGAAKMAARMGIDEEKCREILTAFDAGVPYITLLARALSNKAASVGFVRTVLGRHRHFNHWKPCDTQDMPIKGLEAARAHWGPDAQLERAWTYKAFNALIQGSAGDQSKRALVEINRAIGLPMHPVHDEISKSVENEKEALVMKEIMENCVKLECPAQTDMDLGASWC